MSNQSFFGNYSVDHGFGPKVHYGPLQIIPVWHLPLHDATAYVMCDAPGDDNLYFTVRTATADYTSLVTSNKAAELLAQLPADLPRFLIEEEEGVCN